MSIGNLLIPRQTTSLFKLEQPFQTDLTGLRFREAWASSASSAGIGLSRTGSTIRQMEEVKSLLVPSYGSLAKKKYGNCYFVLAEKKRGLVGFCAKGYISH